MNLRKIYYLMLIVPMLFIYTGCSEDDPVTPSINEAEVMVEYLEANGNPVTTFAKMIKADVVNANILSGADQVVIDIRAADAYAAGHITGAVNVPSTEVLSYYEDNNLQNKATVVIACYSGQTAAWVNGLLNTMGYTNASDLKWGMCSWNPATSGSWTSATNVNNSRAAQFVQTATAKPEAGELPALETGEKDGASILRARVEFIFAEGFGLAKVSSDDVYSNLSGYHIANYWSEEHYSSECGHIDGAMQYTPKDGFTLGADLKTLPTDKTVAVYCYTGQTSAHVAAYLRVLGYDAVSVLFGVNGMSYNNIPTAKFNPESDIHDYDLEQ